MAKDFIGYKALTDAALRGVVRDALRRAEKQGLVGSHHFYLTFLTKFPGVEIPDFLREQYPEEMTIIIQHQFWGLKVTEDTFEVTLSFKKLPATLTIPFQALTAFADPGVQFGLQFKDGEQAKGPKPVPVQGDGPVHAAIPVKTQNKAEKPAETPPAADKPATPAEVVSLDAFRKK
ncbi:MAG: hypothetical protein HY243_06575 [Proteobacteria bacterium]|nr:hypothetical protein [Pseudomonadota bacterium]